MSQIDDVAGANFCLRFFCAAVHEMVALGSAAAPPEPVKTHR